eukprot:249176-Chlamydomonas_euryale.AAC.3
MRRRRLSNANSWLRLGAAVMGVAPASVLLTKGVLEPAGAGGGRCSDMIASQSGGGGAAATLHSKYVSTCGQGWRRRAGCCASGLAP